MPRAQCSPCAGNRARAGRIRRDADDFVFGGAEGFAGKVKLLSGKGIRSGKWRQAAYSFSPAGVPSSEANRGMPCRNVPLEEPVEVTGR